MWRCWPRGSKPSAASPRSGAQLGSAGPECWRLYRSGTPSRFEDPGAILQYDSTNSRKHRPPSTHSWRGVLLSGGVCAQTRPCNSQVFPADPPHTRVHVLVTHGVGSQISFWRFSGHGGNPPFLPALGASWGQRGGPTVSSGACGRREENVNNSFWRLHRYGGKSDSPSGACGGHRGGQQGLLALLAGTGRAYFLQYLFAAREAGIDQATCRSYPYAAQRPTLLSGFVRGVCCGQHPLHFWKSRVVVGGGPSREFAGSSCNSSTRCARL